MRCQQFHFSEATVEGEPAEVHPKPKPKPKPDPNPNPNPNPYPNPNPIPILKPNPHPNPNQRVDATGHGAGLRGVRPAFDVLMQTPRAGGGRGAVWRGAPWRPTAPASRWGLGLERVRVGLRVRICST